jgi:hypothetical protein
LEGKVSYSLNKEVFSVADDKDEQKDESQSGKNLEGGG